MRSTIGPRLRAQLAHHAASDLRMHSADCARRQLGTDRTQDIGSMRRRQPPDHLSQSRGTKPDEPFRSTRSCTVWAPGAAAYR